MRKNEKITNISKAVVAAVHNVVDDNIHKILLYGSYARGDYDEESDMDIMVIIECTQEQIEKYRSRMSKYASRISLEFDLEVSIVLKDRDTFYKYQNILPFYRNVLSDGIELHG